MAAAVTFLLLVTWSPRGYAGVWSGKTAVFLVGGAVGLALAPRLWTVRRLETSLAASFVVVALISTVLSAQPLTAVFGLYDWGTGLLFVLGLVGCWVLGASAAGSGSQRVLLAAVAGLSATCIVGVLQVAVDLRIPFPQEFGRAIGLAGNATHLAALAGALVAIGAVEGRRRPSWLLFAVLGALGGQVSGSRAILVVCALVIMAAFVWWRWAYALSLTLVIVVGLGLGAVATSSGGTESALTRTADTAAGTNVAGGAGLWVRAPVWRTGLRAVAVRPVVGSGPGLFRLATSPDEPLTIARTEGSEPQYADAHNFFLEYAVTTGIAGVVALIAWLWLAFRGARGALAAAAGALLVTSLFAPLSTIDTPLMFLFLGAASVMSLDTLRLRVSDRSAVGVAVVVAMVAATSLFLGDVQLRRALVDENDQAAKTAERLIGVWPAPFAASAAIASVRADRARSRNRVDAIESWHDAIDRDRSDAHLWNALAAEFAAANQTKRARTAFLRALHYNPWSVTAMLGLARIYRDQGRTGDALVLLERASRVQTSPGLTREIRKLRAVGKQ